MRKADAQKLWAVARTQADEFMEAQGAIEAVVVPDSEEGTAKAALRHRSRAWTGARQRASSQSLAEIHQAASGGED
jgi:hypothetical protein